MKKLLYLGHNYHLKTKSTLFLIDLLKEQYDVDFVSYDPYKNEYEGLKEAKGKLYDVLVVFQIMPPSEFLEGNFVYKQGVLVPMYDYIITRNYDPWSDYRRFRIINFCKSIHEELLKRGYESYYVQYFPKPEGNQSLGDVNSIFFWQRMERINISTISALFAEQKIDHIHIHKALDPKQKFVEPETRLADMITYSEWFGAKEEMQEVMLKSAWYIAPREYEGIGMSFLEAMAAGRCVVASNTPTMNEYIQNGVNGFLYDIDDPQPIPLCEVRDIQANARKYIEDGYKKWEKDKYEILKWIEEEREKPLVTVVTVVRNAVQGGRAETLVQCLESVHTQLYPNIEHLVVDGASTDGTHNILRMYQEQGWITVHSEPDNGMYEAMNKGIRLAKGKYIVFLNTDDYFHNRFAISDSAAALENSGADFSYASNRLLTESGVCRTIRKPEIGSFVAQMPFCHQTMFTKKDVLVEIGLFDETYKSSADYDLVLRLILGGYRYVEVETDIVTYRSGGVSESLQRNADLEKYEIYKRQYQRYYGNVTDILARELAGRKCPVSLVENIKKDVSVELGREIDNAIIQIDKDNVYCCFPEEKIVSMGYEVRDSAGGASSERIAGLLTTVDRQKARMEKFIKYFGLLDRWLWLKLQDKGIKEFFELKGYQKIAIYGFGEIGNRLYEELSRTSDVRVIYVIDSNADKKRSHLKVYKPQDALPEVDVIVVSVDYIYDEIAELLSDKVNCPIISIDDVVFGI